MGLKVTCFHILAKKVGAGGLKTHADEADEKVHTPGLKLTGRCGRLAIIAFGVGL